MKIFNLKSIFYSLLTLGIVSLSIISCNNDDASENLNSEDTTISPDEFFNQVTNDALFSSFASSRDQLERVVEEVVKKNNMSAKEFETLYDTKNEEALQELFANTDIIKISEQYEAARIAVNNKYPTLYAELDQSISGENLVSNEGLTAQSFEFLDSTKGAKCSKKRRALKIACYVACGAVGCSGGPITCALSRFACKKACDRIC